MGINSRPIYRCPHCLSIKISQDDLGQNCPQCNTLLPPDLKPSYHSRDNSFRKHNSSNKLKPKYIIGCLLLAGLLAWSYTKSTQNGNLKPLDISRIGSKAVSGLGDLNPVARLDFDDITNCFQMLRYIQQSGLEISSLQTSESGWVWVSLGKIINISSSDKFYSDIAKTHRFQPYFYDDAYMATRCNQAAKEDEKLRYQGYSEFISRVENNQIKKVIIYKNRGTAITTSTNGEVFRTNLAPDKDLLRLLQKHSVEYFLADSYLSHKDECNGTIRGRFYSGDPHEIAVYAEYLKRNEAGQIIANSNPKKCSFSLPSEYIEKGIAGSSVLTNTSVTLTKYTNGQVTLTQP